MIDFSRYLLAKRTVDDRALNRQVWQKLVEVLGSVDQESPLRILEVGCGIGTMVERTLEWGLINRADYTGLDIDPENIKVAFHRLGSFGNSQGWEAIQHPGKLDIQKEDLHWQIEFKAADIRTHQSGKKFDLIISHAFLDLLDIPKVLPKLKSLVSRGGLFYFTINFDGVTIFEPVSDPTLNAKIIHLYHQTMDERLVNGELSGDSRSGRHLFHFLRDIGAQVLAAGASDWVVFPTEDGYPADEAYFLHSILYFIENSLSRHPDLDLKDLELWLSERRSQIQNRTLSFIAHQLDFCGYF